MLHITIDGTDYTAFDSWKSMPLSKAVELSLLCTKEMPVGLSELYSVISKSKGDDAKKEISEQSNKTSDEDYIKNFPAFYGKVMKCLTDIPQDVIDKTSPGSRIEFYNVHLFKFVFGILHYPTDIENTGIESFVHNKITYHLPKSKTVLGEVRPMADRTAIEFAEAADLELFSKQLEGGRFERAANIISILCRPMVLMSNADILETELTGLTKNKFIKSLSKKEQRKLSETLKQKAKSDYQKLEPYNEDTCLKRADEFKDLPMDIVWQVFFCLMQQSVLLNQNISISFLEGVQKQRRQEEVPV